MIYDVLIKETSYKTVSVIANSFQEATDKINEALCDGKIEHDFDDCETSIEAVEEY